MTTRPTRFQRSRREGARLPKDCVFVGRPSRWGNPWPVDALRAVMYGVMYDTAAAHLPDGLTRAYVNIESPAAMSTDFDLEAIARRAAVDLYRLLAMRFAADDPTAFRAWIDPLRGRHLACWCERGWPCHADVLLELANR